MLIKNYIIRESCGRQLLSAATLTALLCVMSGCSLVNDTPEPSPTPGVPEGRSLEMRMEIHPGQGLKHSTQKRKTTRVDDEGHPQEEAADIIEDAINISQKDFALYMFDENDICCFASNAEGAEYQAFGAPGSGYLISTRLTNYVIPENENPNTSFTVIVIANMLGAGGSYPKVTVSGSDGTSGTKLDDFRTSVNNLSFSLGYDNTINWYPGLKISGDVEAYIPMYGENVYTVKKSALEEALINGYLELDAVNMLRALAKIEIIDGIEKGADGFPKISKVTLGGNTFITNGLVFPNERGADGQVSEYRLPEGQSKSTLSWSLTQLSGNKIVGTDANGNDIKKDTDYWRIYLPEQLISAGNPLTYTIDIDNSTAGNNQYTVNMNDQSFQEAYKNKILRNHIYRIVITSVSAEGGLNYTVCPREKFEVTIPTFN